MSLCALEANALLRQPPSRLGSLEPAIPARTRSGSRGSQFPGSAAPRLPAAPVPCAWAGRTGPGLGGCSSSRCGAQPQPPPRHGGEQLAGGGAEKDPEPAGAGGRRGGAGGQPAARAGPGAEAAGNRKGPTHHPGAPHAAPGAPRPSGTPLLSPACVSL